MRKLNSKKTRIILSITALVEVLILVAGVTFSWIEGGDRGYVNGSEIVISTGSNLTMRQDGKTTNSIIIPSCTLEEVSSADGRNYFFPMGDNTTNITSSMKFREGTPADENTKYLSIDFELTAGDSVTDVYLGAGTIVQCDNKDVMDALRMSFSKNDGSTPIVFKPTQMPGVTMSYSPIASITQAGVPTTTTTSTQAYANYAYNGSGSTPIFTLAKGETLNITLSIWLEGTEFSGDDVTNKELDIYIDFTTTIDDLVKYNFVDNTHGYGDAKLETWISNTDTLNGSTYETMMYIYDVTAGRYYAMNKTSDTTWEVYAPKTITNFCFRRYSIDIDQWWNEWEPSMSDIKTDPNGEHTYVAICGNGAESGTELSGSYGYWKDQYGTYRVYFQMECAWNDLHCYAWRSSGTACASTGAWPGKAMTFVKNVDNDPYKPLYYIELKESDNVAGIQFNNGSTATTVYLGKNYGANTHAYVFGDTGEVLGAWPGTKATYDNATGMYKIDFKTGTAGTNFDIIVNNGNGGAGNQFPESGGYRGTTGNAYDFYEGSFNSRKLQVNLDDLIPSGENVEDYIFNGMCLWYKTSDSGKYGLYTYRGSEGSMIYPQ